MWYLEVSKDGVITEEEVSELKEDIEEDTETLEELFGKV